MDGRLGKLEDTLRMCDATLARFASRGGASDHPLLDDVRQLRKETLAQIARARRNADVIGARLLAEDA